MPTTTQRIILATSIVAALGALADSSVRFVVLFFLLLCVPGYLVERILPSPRPPLLARSAIWIALSLSLNALLYQWLWAAGLNLGTSALWLGVGLISAAGLGAAWRDLGVQSALPLRLCAFASKDPPLCHHSDQWSNLLTLAIVTVTIAARRHDSSSLTFPPWVDSVHHALLIRIAAEIGSAPISLAPYLPVENLPYHWGYHVFIANLLRLSGLDLLNTMLLSGQLLNALQALTVAGLAQSLWRRPLAAPVAALIVGCISLMPAYYLSWGRYTQLTGLLMLPGLAVAWAWGLGGSIAATERRGTQGIASSSPLSHNVGEGGGGEGHLGLPKSLSSPPASRSPLPAPRFPLPWLLSSLILAGLSLVHFRILLFALALLATLSLMRILGGAMPHYASSRALPPLPTPSHERTNHLLLKPQIGSGDAIDGPHPPPPSPTLWERGRRHRDFCYQAWFGLLCALASGIAAILLTLPWLWLLYQRTLAPVIAAESSLAGGGSYNALNSGLLWVGPNHLLVALALLSGWWTLRQRRQAPVIILLWVSLMLIMANPWLLSYLLPATGLLMLLAALRKTTPPNEDKPSADETHTPHASRLTPHASRLTPHASRLTPRTPNAAAPRRLALLISGSALLLLNPFLFQIPYLWLIPNDVVVISLFMPLALLISGGGALFYQQIAPRLGRAAPLLLLCSIVGSGAWGLHTMQPSIINRATALGTPAELTAINWIAAHTPTDARILVNAAPWLPTARRGADAGWWLMPLAQRWTTAPPVLFTYSDAAYVSHINALNDTIINYTAGQEQLILDLIANEGITHIYLVEGRGPLERSLFEGRTGFQVVYDVEGVVVVGVGGDVRRNQIPAHSSTIP